MENKTIIFSGLCLLAGAAAGVVVGMQIAKKRYEEEIVARREHEKERQAQKAAVKEDNGKKVSIDDEDAPKPITEADYKQYNKLTDEYAPTGTDITEEVEEFDEEHGMEVKIVPPMLYDPDVYPEGPRDTPQLYFFDNGIDSVLCTESGEIIQDTDPIYDPFFNSEWANSTDEGPMYIVDNINKIDYIVTRISDDSYDGWFPSSPED